MGGEGLLNEHIAMQRVATVGLPGFEFGGELFLLCWRMKFGGSANFFSGDLFLPKKMKPFLHN